MSQTHVVNLELFDKIIEEQQSVVLDFWAEWCGPCKMLSPIFEELARLNPDIYFGKVNVEEAKDLAEAFHVRSIPTLLAFRNGEIIFEKAGVPHPKELEALLKELRKKDETPSH